VSPSNLVNSSLWNFSLVMLTHLCVEDLADGESI